MRQVDQFIETLSATKSYSMAKQARTGVEPVVWAGGSVRRDPEELVRDTNRLYKPPSQATALTATQVEADPSRFVRRVSRRHMPTTQAPKTTPVERHATSRAPTQNVVPCPPSSRRPVTMHLIKPACALNLRKSGQAFADRRSTPAGVIPVAGALEDCGRGDDLG